MSHSKGFLAGTCPGSYRNHGRVQDDGPDHKKQQQRCGRCGKVRWKRVRKCWMFHQYRDSGKAREGVQKQKCARCADKREVPAKRCGGLLWSGCSWHRCREQREIHCRFCARTRD
jgi:hypothetical protein